MADKPTDFAAERLVRRAPEARPLVLGEDDRAYVMRCLTGIEEAFGLHVVPDVPLDVLPGRALMRKLVSLRTELRPQTPEQREAWGRLSGAILLLDTACAFAEAHRAASRR